jgi:hypothetical protein
MNNTKSKKKAGHSECEISRVLSDGILVETIFDPLENKTGYLVGNEHQQRCHESVQLDKERSLRPPKAHNNLIKHGVMLLPSGVKEYGDTDVLLWSLEAYFRRYCDLRPEYIKTAASYILLTWLYDRFNELPYLRLMGSYGTGKTRFLLTVGSVAYRPLFGSGASTVSPIFHLLNEYRGTLILDEADFRFSDKSADITKILNNGNVKGFPVLRCAKNEEGTFDPRAFNVFGPKIIATRGRFQDPALESRFITEVVYPKALRSDVPINLPNAQKQEALELRNQLLLFRFRNWHRTDIDPNLSALGLEGRVAQIFKPLLSVISNSDDRALVLDVALKAHSRVKEDRSERKEVRLLHSLFHFHATGQRPAVGDVSIYLRERHDLTISPRQIGALLRAHFELSTVKSGGVFRVEGLNARKLRQAAEVLGVSEGLPSLDATTESTSPTSTMSGSGA